VAGRFRRVHGGLGGRGGHGRVAVTLDDVEARILRHLLDELLELLGEDETPEADDAGDPLAADVGIGAATTIPDDPVLARLFPDAYTSDPEAAAEFRRYTERDLRSRKRSTARAVLATLDAAPGRLVLSAEQAQAWLGALNDLRLALGERLGITEDHYDEDVADDDDPRAYPLAVYDLLTFLQETLVRSLD
jgi:hypothetical protein